MKGDKKLSAKFQDLDYLVVSEVREFLKQNKDAKLRLHTSPSQRNSQRTLNSKTLKLGKNKTKPLQSDKVKQKREGKAWR